MAGLVWKEVIPEELFWAPACRDPPRGFTGAFVDVFKIGGIEGKEDVLFPEEELVYGVMHYPEEAVGRCFGPLGLSAVLWFCRALSVRMERAGAGGVALHLSDDTEASHTNACVLLGAYLILEHAWSATDVAKCLGEAEAIRTFACSWARKDRPVPPRNLTVRHCWNGYEHALRQGWLDPACICSDEGTEYTCSGWKYRLATYDCAWLVPGLIMVCADPVTTACDPNPATFVNVFREQATPSTEPDAVEPATVDVIMLDTPSPRSPRSPAPRTTSRSRPRFDFTSFDHTEQSEISPAKSAVGSTDTVCKQYRACLATPKAGDKPLEFVTFIKDSGVSFVVRTNFHREPGMPKKGSYDAAEMEAHGLAHQDILVEDFNGGMPKRQDIKKMLTVCPDGVGEGAVLVHCKGGFGRSVILACCLAMDRLDVPGAALLGWVRTVRPGSVNTAQQEKFLLSMGGRTDIRRYAQLPLGAEHPKGCCSVQ